MSRRKRNIAALWLTMSIVLAPHLVFAKRHPLPRPFLPKKLVLKPVEKGMRLNVQTKQWEEFDQDPRIEFDNTRSVYSVSWADAEGRRIVLIVDPPTKLDVVIQGSVKPGFDGRSFSYAYSVQNLKTSEQRLQSVYIETKAKIKDVAKPDGGWYSRPFTDYLKEMLSMPEGWAWTDTKFDRLGVPPDASASGLGFSSMGLPSVVRCSVSGYWGGLKTIGGKSGEGPPQLFEALKPVTWKLPNGVTVGPAEPPQPFNPIRFLRTLNEYLAISLQNGWIDSHEVAGHIQKSLDQLRTTLEKGDRKQTGIILRDLLTRIEAEKEKALLPEAYALLKFNLAYLEQRLQETK